eukprot:gene7108-12760_t
MHRHLILTLAFICTAAAVRPKDVRDPGLYQGDMRLTAMQKLLVLTGGDVSTSEKSGLAFGSSKDQSLLWLPSRVVPYEISADLAANQEAMFAIFQGFREWESYACLKFVERTTEKDYIYIFNNCSGCWSYVGRQGGKQELCLDNGCHSRATVAHELAHAMGFWHEQSRPDRDNYIDVIWENIDPDNAYNFDKQKKVDSLGTPYDYYSMMQYDETSFTMNGNITMAAKQPGVVQLGNEVGFTGIDSVQAMLLYRCNGKTTKPAFRKSVVDLKGADDCIFDDDFCHFTQANDDDFDWTLRKGATYSGGTGPSVDHTTGRLGAFAYIEASYPRVENDTARMLSKMLNGKKCMTFYIHMYSADPVNIGKFNVHLKEARTGSMRRLISLSGSQGNEWKKIRLNLSSRSKKGSYQVIFEGIRGKNYQGDIAIDDVSFQDGSCKSIPATTMPPTVPCQDTTDREGPYCSTWKAAGFCESHKADMKDICRKTCDFCE